MYSNENTTVVETSVNATTDAIDQAIAKAKARKVARDNGGEFTAATLFKVEKSPKKVKQTPEEKAVVVAAKLAARLDKKALRSDKRIAKAALRLANQKPAHLTKVERAAGKLPALNDSAQEVFNDVSVNFSANQIAALAAHLNHFNRAQSTARALSTKLEVGQEVRFVFGDPWFIGQVGIVAKVQRIRALIAVEGIAKPVYVFSSDVEVMASDVLVTGTDS